MKSLSHPVRKAIRVATFALAVLGLGLGAMDPAIGWVIPLALGGGGLTAAVLVAVRSRQDRAPFAPDHFSGEGPIGVMDLSHVRVAGVGGVGLLILSGVIALQYELIAAASVAGAVGGTVAGIAMIAYRRRDAARREVPGHLI
jgi:hypothetical protein